MGFRNISIFDDDVVSIENIGPQAHNLCDIGLPKVEAVRRAGIAARGVEIAAYNRRVHSLGDIREALGYTPDILITCTDSAEFRNGFITGLASAFRHDAPQEYATGTSYPDLLLDYRMSLGDWTCYAIPLRIMRRIPRQSMLAQYCAKRFFLLRKPYRKAAPNAPLSIRGQVSLLIPEHSCTGGSPAARPP